MNEKEKLLLEIKALISDSTKESVDKATLEARITELNDKIAKLSKPEIDSLPEAVNKLIQATSENTAAINAMKEKPMKVQIEKPLSKKDQFKQALLDAFVEAGKNVPGLIKEVTDSNGTRLSARDYFTKLGNKHSPEMTLKVAVDFLESNIVQSNVATVRLTELDPNRVSIPLTIYPHVTEWMPGKTITRPTMSLLVVYSYEDGAGYKTEGSAASQSSFLLKTVEFKSFVIGTYGTLSDETLEDLPEAMEEVARTFPSKILDNVDTHILGTLGDDSTALAGLFTSNKMTAFASGTTYLASTANANKIDVIAKMKLQCKKNKYIPDSVIMNASDIEALAAEKDQLDNSKLDRRIVYNAIGEPVAICGLRLYLSEAMTADTVAVVKSDMLQIGDRRTDDPRSRLFR